MAKKTAKREMPYELAAYVRPSERTTYDGTRVLEIDVYVVARGPDDNPRGISPYDFDSTDTRYAVGDFVLTLTAYADSDNRTPVTDIRLRDTVAHQRRSYVTALASVDKMLSRGLDKLADVAGPVRGTALAYRFAKVLGAEGTLMRDPSDGSRMLWAPLDNLASVLDHKFFDFFAAYAPKKTDAPA